VNQLQAHRARLRQQRQQQEAPSIALVGYTNAGKSTLLNVLTHAEVYTADRLFATLDQTTRKIVITDPQTQERRSVFLTDTVGFIHELPPPLMDAFRATLEEVTEAGALVKKVSEMTYDEIVAKRQKNAVKKDKYKSELEAEKDPSTCLKINKKS
jgi:GTP-binding protein HflX